MADQQSHNPLDSSKENAVPRGRPSPSSLVELTAYPAKGTTLREFMVDFFGSLVPGIAFVLGTFPAVLLPGHSLLHRLQNKKAIEDTFPLAEFVDSTIFSMAFFVALLVLAYIVGHILFRQDPKVPDQHSFKRLAKSLNTSTKDEHTFDVPMKMGSDHRDVEFPYLYLWEFLDQRGLGHLAQHVPWQGGDKASYERRSKHFVNGLKVRLEFLFPSRYSRVARNEAHVRLMSSMWYGSTVLLYLAGIGLVLGVARNLPANPMLADVDVIGLPLLVLGAAYLIKVGIERVLFYQRVREVVFVLETAHIVDSLDPDTGIFVGLEREQETRTKGT